MEKMTQLTGIVAPLDRANVDTDAIIPKQFLKSIKRTGFGPNLFDEWRYLDPGEPGQEHQHRSLNPDFVLNQPRYQDATLLLTQENFGCGSSREHAPWALLDYGFRVIIAPSFADIFFSNSFKNGLLLIILDQGTVARLFKEVVVAPGYRLTVDLPAQTLKTPADEVIHFDIEPFKKHCLLNALDDIALTLQHSAEIKNYEAQRMLHAPWLFS